MSNNASFEELTNQISACQICQAELPCPPILNHLSKVELTVILGQYAIDYHLNNASLDSDKSSRKPAKISVTSAVANWKQYWPSQIVLPHPSPRNNIWLKRHPEFEAELLPQLKLRVHSIIS